MGKGKRLKTKKQGNSFLAHAQEVFTRNFQKEIRNSEFWPMMVAEHGEKKAEELLSQCKGALKPGVIPNEARNSPTDLQ